MGDYVRVPVKRDICSKGYTADWNRELFEIHKINKANPGTYGLVEDSSEQIEGKYFQA